MDGALIVAALIVSVLLLMGLMSLLKTTFKTAFLIAVVVFATQILTGIGPGQIFQQVLRWFGGIGEWLSTWGNRAKPPTDVPSPRQLLHWLWTAALLGL
jgi:nitrate/nitrite transporter NarK